MYYECNSMWWAAGGRNRQLGKKKAALAQQPCGNANKDMRISKVWDKIRRMNVANKIPQEWVVLLKEKANLQEVVVSVIRQRYVQEKEMWGKPG